MLIPGQLIALLTFPGVIVHEFAHQLFCKIYRTAVLEVCYFRPANPAGYVIHEHPRSSFHQLMIGIGPFFFNSILGALIAIPAAIPVIQFDSGSPVDYFLIWLGVSIAMHSFPSTGDAKSIWHAVKNEKTPILTKILATPIVGLIYLGAAGSIFWLDLAYGYGVAMFLPKLLIRLFG